MTGNEMEDLVPRKHIPSRDCTSKVLQNKLQFIVAFYLINIIKHQN